MHFWIFESMGITQKTHTCYIVHKQKVNYYTWNKQLNWYGSVAKIIVFLNPSMLEPVCSVESSMVDNP